MHCSLQNYSTRNLATSFTSCQRHWYAALQHARVWMTSIHWELFFLQSLPYVPPPKARRDEMRKIVRSAAAGVAPKESFPLGDDRCYQTQKKKETLEIGDTPRQRAQFNNIWASSLRSGANARRQARKNKLARVGNQKRGWVSHFDIWSTLPLLSHSLYSTFHSTRHPITHYHSAHLSCRLMIYARLTVVRKWFFGGAKEVFCSVYFLLYVP